MKTGKMERVAAESLTSPASLEHLNFRTPTRRSGLLSPEKRSRRYDVRILEAQRRASMLSVRQTQGGHSNYSIAGSSSSTNWSGD